MSLKKTNGIGLKKGKNIKHKAKYFNINLTQITENLIDYCHGSVDIYFGQLC